MAISAKIIEGSLSPQGLPISTWVLTFPRIVLAEFNTHRMFSRNSASSRAIPFKKMLEMVQNDPFIPIRWMKEHTGMQGTEYFTSKDSLKIPDSLYGGKIATLKMLEMSWLNARNSAVVEAVYLDSIGCTKQICNRLLEPFMWHTVLLTTTEIENFFALRAHPAAEIHIADLAQKMLDEWNNYTPKQLKAGEWHMPFGDQIDKDRLYDLIDSKDSDWLGKVDEYRLKISTARCARISYGTFEGKDDYEADIKLHDRLAASGHWSPFEHCARAMSDSEFSSWGRRTVRNIDSTELNNNGFFTSSVYESGWCGNFKSFVQYRKLFPNENAKDPRVKKWTIN
jgi:thymidylate synthase ThyX